MQRICRLRAYTASRDPDRRAGESSRHIPGSGDTRRIAGSERASVLRWLRKSGPDGLSGKRGGGVYHRNCLTRRRRLDSALREARLTARSQHRIGPPTGAGICRTETRHECSRLRPRDLPGQVVLVLQGGGALGSYQAGVYQALHEAGIEPDWIIGTSIGAINASLIALYPAVTGSTLCVSPGSAWSRSGRGISFRPLAPTRSSAVRRRVYGIAGFVAKSVSACGDTYALGPERAADQTTLPWKRFRQLVDSTLSLSARHGSPSRCASGARARCAISTAATRRDPSVKHVMGMSGRASGLPGFLVVAD